MAIVPPTARVDVWELRCRFNRARYWQRQQSGEFYTEVKSRPAGPKAKQPPGALSQEVHYIDARTRIEVARVHQYLLTSGALGASRRPDPKRLWIDGVIYQLPAGSDEAVRDPSLRLPAGILRISYIRWRRLKCILLGR